MVKLVFKLFVVIFLAGMLYVATNNSSSIRERLLGAKSAVAGASTSKEAVDNSFPSKLKDDTKNQIQNLQEQVLEVKIGEIFSFFSQAGKIIDDFHMLQRNVSQELDDNEK